MIDHALYQRSRGPAKVITSGTPKPANPVEHVRDVPFRAHRQGMYRMDAAESRTGRIQPGCGSLDGNRRAKVKRSGAVPRRMAKRDRCIDGRGTAELGQMREDVDGPPGRRVPVRFAERTVWNLITRRATDTPDGVMAIDERRRSLTFAHYSAALRAGRRGTAGPWGDGRDPTSPWQLPTRLDAWSSSAPWLDCRPFRFLSSPLSRSRDVLCPRADQVELCRRARNVARP